jgi:hypothetical protein
MLGQMGLGGGHVDLSGVPDSSRMLRGGLQACGRGGGCDDHDPDGDYSMFRAEK